jgi:Ca2+-dependent lipid-binding protein
LQIGYEEEFQRLSVTVVECQDLKNMDTFGKSDPFVEVLFVPGKHVEMKTKVIRNDLNPVFDNEVFKSEVSQ